MDYSGSEIIIKGSEVEMLIEEGSKVDIDGRIIMGKEKNLSEIFY